MITSNEKQEFKVILGNRYSIKIQQYCQDNSIVDGSGKVFSKGMIRQVFNGYAVNFELEAAITEVVKLEKSKRRKLQKKKEAISNI